MSGSWSGCRSSCMRCWAGRFTQVGGFLALWVIGYGFVQAAAPRIVRRSHHGGGPGGGTREAVGLDAGVFPGRYCAGFDRAEGWARRPVLDRRPDPVRDRLCDQLGGALIPDPGLLGLRQGLDERRLLLHGQRRRADSPVPYCRVWSTRLRVWRAACGGPPASCWPPLVLSFKLPEVDPGRHR